MDKDQDHISRADLAAVMTEWQRRYISDPDQYERDWETVEQFKQDGGELAYGEKQANYVFKLNGEFSNANEGVQ